MKNGIKISGKKEMSISEEVINISNPKKVYIPLINCGVECTPLIKKNMKVKKGMIIGVRPDNNFPILSSVSGKVVGFKKCLCNDGLKVNSAVIENDFKDTLMNKKEVADISNYTKEEFINIIKDCSITGMGGSNFPTYMKYNAEINTMIVNAVECEPYITADLMLTKLKAPIILETIDAIMKINKIEKCYIGFKKNNEIVKNSLLPYMNKYKNIILYPVPNLYPMGWERNLIKCILKVNYEKYPSEIGIVVNNISTIFAMYKALKFNNGISKRIITISGEGFSNPVNVLVKIGTDMSKIIKKLGSYVEPNNLVFIAGGPMMGKSLPNDSLIATPNLSSILIIPKQNGEINNCIGCGKCIKVCPAKLCPVFIMKNMDNPSKLKELKPKLCVECGLCSYICPSKIGLRNYVIKAKKEVK